MENIDTVTEVDRSTPEVEDIPLLSTPRNDGRGLPPLIETAAAFTEMLTALAGGEGAIAIDAERASGYKYSQRAYLIQIYRRGGGLHLIDPIAVAEAELWSELSKKFSDCEWIIHASTQDLPCLRELSFTANTLFDTELGARIAGCERVGLGPLAESLLGIRLAKEHSAVDWSSRPLPEPWLNYAALDVDVLVDLRDEVALLLEKSGKLAWAEEEFTAILNASKPEPRIDPWRRTSGIHKIKDRRTLAIIKAMWHARDDYGRAIDRAPGRIFNDETLVEIGLRRPATIDAFKKLVTRRRPDAKYPIAEWFALFREVMEFSDEALPPVRLPSTALPPTKMWADRNPLGYARFTHARRELLALSLEIKVPVEILISPEFVRHLLWTSPPSDSALWPEYVREQLRAQGARSWQIGLVAGPLESILGETLPYTAPEPENPVDPEE